ncbi:MAG: SurA N-terminal domain-containing protein [Bacillota bacterium]
MLIQAFRDNIPKWITAVILFLIIGPFALWGINSYFTASSDNSVATVNGDPINPGEYQRVYQGQYARLEQMYGAAFKPELIDEKQLHQQVLDGLINDTLLSQRVSSGHYAVGDAQLVEDIQKMPAFQVAGKFSAQVYRSQLAGSGMSPQEFERRERQAIEEGQFQASLADSAIATPSELASAYAVRGQQREVAYITVSAKKFLPGVHVTDADVQAYYDAHKGDFMTPEKVTLSYVELDEAKLASQAQPTDEDLQALYQQQLDKYKQDETRDARHILIAVNGNDPKVDAAAKAKADDILKQIKGGADFAKLAEQYSDDPGSKKQGGELGQVSRGVMVKPFEDALFGLAKPGDIAGPVRSQFGYHIIQLESVKSAEVKPFSAVRAQLVADYQKKKADDEYFTLGDQLANVAYEHPQSLDEVSKQLNLPIQTMADVTRDGGAGIAANADVRKAAFSDSVLVQGNNSEPIQIGPNHAVVIRVKGHEPSVPKALADVRGPIADLLQQQKAAAAATKLATDMLAAIDKGGDPAAVAKGNAATYTAPAMVSRNQQGVPLPLLTAAFTAAQPAPGGHTVLTVPLDKGDQAVLVVSAVKPGDAATLQDPQRLAALRELSQEDGAAEFAAYLATLKQQAKIKVNAKNIDQSDQ